MGKYCDRDRIDQEDSEGVTLPVENDDSNAHVVSSSNGIISSAGLFVRGGCVSQDDHGELELDSKTWYRFVKNTALRSASIEGMD